MAASITMACNIYQECNAVHGLLESASQFFDELFFFHCGPGGKYSTDGTIETLQKWGVRLEFGSIDAGFGAVRSELIRRSRTDWVMILDADERFYPIVPTMSVEGSEAYPQTPQPNLHCHSYGVSNQGHILREIISDPAIDAVQTCRRHWFDHTWRRPCQNWHLVADWQLRTLRRNGHTGYTSAVKMHEQVTGIDNPWKGHSQPAGPYHDHFHMHYKPMEPEQRREDIATYNWLHEGGVAPHACHSIPPEA